MSRNTSSNRGPVTDGVVAPGERVSIWRKYWSPFGSVQSGPVKKAVPVVSATPCAHTLSISLRSQFGEAVLRAALPSLDQRCDNELPIGEADAVSRRCGEKAPCSVTRVVGVPGGCWSVSGPWQRVASARVC